MVKRSKFYIFRVLQNVNKAAMLRSKTLLLHRDGVRSMAEEQAHLLGSPGREATTVVMLQADLVNLTNIAHRHLERRGIKTR